MFSLTQFPIPILDAHTVCTDDSEYCVLPLTGDIPGAVNPFRCDRQSSPLSGLLVHAILALCCQHRRSSVERSSGEAAEHRRKAFQLLEHALKSRPVLNLLDPILILFTLDVSDIPIQTAPFHSKVWFSVPSPLPELGQL